MSPAWAMHTKPGCWCLSEPGILCGSRANLLTAPRYKDTGPPQGCWEPTPWAVSLLALLLLFPNFRMITIQGSEFGHFHSHEISSLVLPTSAAHSVTTAPLQGCALHITVISIPVIILSADWQADAQRDCDLPGHMAGGRQPGHEHCPARPGLAKLTSFKPKVHGHGHGVGMSVLGRSEGNRAPDLHLCQRAATCPNQHRPRTPLQSPLTRPRTSSGAHLPLCLPSRSQHSAHGAPHLPVSMNLGLCPTPPPLPNPPPSPGSVLIFHSLS